MTAVCLTFGAHRAPLQCHFNQNRIGAKQGGDSQRADPKKFATGYLRHCFELSKHNTLIDSPPGSSTLSG